MAANEQAANPMNRKTDPNTMSASWLRSIARSWFSNCPPPEHRQDTRLDVGDGARRFDRGTGRLGKIDDAERITSKPSPTGLWKVCRPSKGW
jgi:hypothetical protein